MSNQYSQPEQPAGLQITPSDIVYIVFRHKWKIALGGVIGFAAAIAVYFVMPAPFSSTARLFVRYVEEGVAPTIGVDDTSRSKPQSRGDTIMASEMQILTSSDLSIEVAKAIGPGRILDDPTKKHWDTEAAKIVNSGISVGIPSKSTIIQVQFTHPNPAIVQPILSELIAGYLKKHQEIHHSSELMNGFIEKQKDEYKARLSRIEGELKSAYAKAGITSLPDAKSEFGNKASQIRNALFDANAEMAYRKATIDEMRKLMPSSSPNPNKDKQEIEAPQIDPAVLSAYANATSRLDLLQRREQELLLKYTPENVIVVGVRQQITEFLSKKQQLENENPVLTYAAPQTRTIGQTAQPSDVVGKFHGELIGAAALQAKMEAFEGQLAQVDQSIERVKNAEIEINELLRNKELVEASYRYFSSSSEQARVNQAFSTDGVRGIGMVQSPSSPNKDNKKTYQIMAGVAGGGFALGLAWVFALELFINRTIKRSVDIERHLHLPLFLSIPDTKHKSFRRILKNLGKGNLKLLAASKGSKKAKSEEYNPKSTSLIAAAKSAPEEYGSKQSANGSSPSPWEDNHELHNYYEALRDRVIGFFESRNLTHKPKLIGLTGVGNAPGVTTIAAGLAGCLSKTGEGNVLLVDMTLGQESAQQFYHGKAVTGIDEALEARPPSENRDNLYVVAEGTNGYKLPKILPNRFNHLVPKLKASDFDYIIFDMPPVSPISVTPRLASYMDAMLMVIESEQTDSDVARKAAELLAQSNAHVGAILNKTKTYVPGKLQPEFIGM